MTEGHRGGTRARVGALDGVRGLALVAVTAFHAFPELVPGGFFGVESFFVLSGFLLARVLLAEHARTGTMDLGAFARRRVGRLAPALCLLLATLVVVAPLVARADAHRLAGDVAWSAVGLTNWHLVVDQSSYFSQLGRPPLVRHLWSVAVEAQFYVLCPFLVLWVARRRRRVAATALAAGIAASAALLGLLAGGADPFRAYYGTDTRLGALLSGVLLALVLRGHPDPGPDGDTRSGGAGRPRARAAPWGGPRACEGSPGGGPLAHPVPWGGEAVGTAPALDEPRWTGATPPGRAAGSGPTSSPAPWRPRPAHGDALVLVGALVLVLLCWRARDDQRALYPLGFLAAQAATAAMIAGALHGAGVARLLGAGPMRWLGQRSYGIYLWHWPLVAVLRPGIDVGWSPAVAGLVSIAGALLLGHASFVLVERPLLGGRRPTLVLPAKARPVAVACSALLAAGLVGVGVRLPTTDPVAEAIRTGEQVLAIQAAAAPPSAPPAPPPIPPATAARPTSTTTTTTRPAPTTTSAVPTTGGDPLEPPPPTLLPAPPPGAVAVTAVGDSVMLSAAAPLKAQLGGSGTIDAKVSRQFRDGLDIVSELGGQNRLASMVLVHLGTNGPPSGADVDALVAAAAGKRVLLVTVRLNRSWMDESNRVLRAAAARHATVTLVDWSAHSEGRPEWFLSDGTHLTRPGADAYTALVGSGLAASLAPPPASSPPVP